MKKKELIRRIEDLEARIRDLEATNRMLAMQLAAAQAKQPGYDQLKPPYEVWCGQTHVYEGSSPIAWWEQGTNTISTEDVLGFEWVKLLSTTASLA